MSENSIAKQNKPFTFFSWLFSRPLLFGGMVFLVIGSLIGVIISLRYQNLKNKEEQNLKQVLESTKSRLQLALNQSLMTTQALAFIVKSDGLSFDFDSAAASLLTYNNAIDAVQLVPGGIIKYVYPLEGNESVIGYNLLQDPLRNQEALKAINERRLFFAGPFPLIQGGLGIVGRLPIFIGNKFWGFSAVVIKFSTLLKSAGIDTTGRGGHYYQLSKINPVTGNEEFFLPLHKLAASNSTSIIVPDGEWKLSVMPVVDFIGIRDILTILLFGMAIALLSTWLAYSLAKKPDQLKKQIDEKSTELEKSSKRNQAILNAIPDTLYVLDTNGKFIDYHNPSNNPTLYSPDFFIGKSVMELLPPGVASQAMENIREVIQAKETLLHAYQLEVNGSLHYYEATYSYSSINEVLIIVRDITKKVLAEMSVKKSEENLWQVLQSTTDIYYVIDTGFKVTLINEVARMGLEKYWGSVVSVGSNILEHAPETVKDQLKRRMQETFKGKKIEYEVPVLEAGRQTWLHVKLTPVKDGTGSITGLAVVTKDISEQKKAEEELQNSYNRFELIIRTTNDAIWEWNLETGQLWGNENHQRLYGLTKNDPIPVHDSWVTRIHPEDRERIVSLQKNALASADNVFISEYRFFTEKRGYLDIYDRCYILRNEEGIAILMTGSMMDISERKKIEKALKESEEKYRTLVEQAVDAITLYDATGKILDVNTGAVNLVGYSKEELLKMVLTEILLEEDVQVDPIAYSELQKGVSTIKQRKMRRKNGTIVQTEVRSQQLPDGRFLSVIRDLTERIKTQEQLKKEKELSDTIINSLPGLFYLVEENYNFLRWNNQFELTLGYASSEMRSKNPLDFFEGSEKELVDQRIKQCFLDGSADMEAHVITKEGKRIQYYFTGIAIEFEGKKCLLGTGIDISEKEKAMEKLDESYKAIRHLTEHIQNIREEERTHIAREIHDELGQQLTVLKMDVAWLNKKIGNTNEAVKEKLHQLLEMIDDTVKSVRRISSSLRPSLLDDLGLVAAIEWQLGEFEKRSGIKTEMVCAETELNLSNKVKTALFRIFQESLTNIARHSNAKSLAVSLEYIDDRIIMSITDDGKGFDQQVIAEKKTLGILGMNERTNMIGGGYKIISSPGNGTKVSVSIPLQENE